jgi:prolyl-tRNA synthetase
MDFYNEVGIGADTFIASASGGDFTHRFSHEFQTIIPAGEDIIYIDREDKISYNKEVVSENSEENIKNFGKDVSKLEQVKACEVGNIFPLETKFTKAINFTYTDENNQKRLVEFMGCYGIGPSRVMGVLVEKFGDEKGLVWPKSVAPFDIEIVSLHKEEGDEVYKKAESIYKILHTPGGVYDVLFDDRNLSAGVKLNDADLYGIPVQIIIGQKSLEEGMVEVKVRKTGQVEKVKVEKIKEYIESIWPEVF